MCVQKYSHVIFFGCIISVSILKTKNNFLHVGSVDGEGKKETSFFVSQMWCNKGKFM